MTIIKLLILTMQTVVKGQSKLYLIGNNTANNTSFRIEEII